jgi:hypothetical protein
MRDCPSWVAACSTTKAMPRSEYMAPRAKSAWPPEPDQYRPAMVSDAHWPMRSTSVVAFIETKHSSVPMMRGSFT